MSETLKSKLAKLEAKIQPNSNSEKSEDLTLDLAQYEYLCKQMQMTMTPQEIQQADEDSQKYLLEWYARYQKMTPGCPRNRG